MRCEEVVMVVIKRFFRAVPYQEIGDFRKRNRKGALTVAVFAFDLLTELKT